MAGCSTACGDCHSNDTRWPWYSNVAPVSWFVIDHVNSGRRRFNYSDWPPPRPDEARKVLKNTCDLVRKGDMPISNYLWMHKDARLSPRDIDVLCAWSEDHREAARAHFRKGTQRESPTIRPMSIYIPWQCPRRWRSGIAAPAQGDVAAQTRRVLDRIRAELAASGSSLEQALCVTVYLTSASDFQAMNSAYRAGWSSDLPTRTTVITDLLTPGALVEMSMIAAPAGAERTVIHPADWVPSPNPYSYAIRSGDTVFLSGLVSRHGRDNAVVTGDVPAQTKVIMDNAGRC